MSLVRIIEYPLTTELLDAKKRSVVLDIGCGTSCFGSFLARKRHDVTCVDIDRSEVEENHKTCKKLGLDNICFVVATSEELPFKHESFSHVIAISTLEHVVNDKKSSFDIRRVLGFDGAFIFSLPFSYFGKNPKIYQGMWQRYYSDKTLKENIILPSAMKVETIRYFGNSLQKAYSDFSVITQWFILKDLVVGQLLYFLEKMLCKTNRTANAVITRLRKCPFALDDNNSAYCVQRGMYAVSNSSKTAILEDREQHYC